MSRPIDLDENIPFSPFTLGFMLAQLNTSDCGEWHRLTGNGQRMPANVRVDNLAGKGFLSAVHRIIFTRFGQEEGEFRVVLKVPTVAVLQQVRPLDSPDKIAFLTSMIAAFHRREVAFYSQILPKYLQNVPDLSPLIPKAWAWKDCQKEGSGEAPNLEGAFLLMEDFSSGEASHIRGDLKEGQVESVIEAMARLHAHSLAIPPELVQSHFWPEKTFRYDKVRLHQQLCSLPGETGPYFTAHSSALTKFIEVTESGQEWDTKVAEQFGVQPPVLCHGDLWVNNLLFNELEVKCILDWQCVHIGSGLSDIGHFLLTGVEPEMRREKTLDWLVVYHKRLTSSLSALPKVPKTSLADLDSVKAIYRTQFPAQVHFLMCLEAFLANKSDDEEDPGMREKMRRRLVQGFEEIRIHYE